MDDWDVFYYDEKNDQVCSLTKYHAENCSVEPLVEAHPDVIYFYAELVPHKDWDFNEYGFAISLDKGPNAFGYGIELVCTGEKNCHAAHHANDCPKWEA